jgi:hypothetical protein
MEHITQISKLNIRVRFKSDQQQKIIIDLKLKAEKGGGNDDNYKYI